MNRKTIILQWAQIVFGLLVFSLQQAADSVLAHTRSLSGAMLLPRRYIETYIKGG